MANAETLPVRAMDLSGRHKVRTASVHCPENPDAIASMRPSLVEMSATAKALATLLNASACSAAWMASPRGIWSRPESAASPSFVESSPMLDSFMSSSTARWMVALGRPIQSSMVFALSAMEASREGMESASGWLDVTLVRARLSRTRRPCASKEEEQRSTICVEMLGALRHQSGGVNG